MNNRKENIVKRITFWDKEISKISHSDNSHLKEMQLKLLLCQLQTDIGDLVETYSNVTKEYFNSELTVKLDFKIKEL